MRYYKVCHIGCKIAQYEAQQVRTLLERYGLLDAGPETPDVCVLNTCAVTAQAASKSRQAIRSLARRYPDARLVILGCYATLAGPSIRDLPNVALVADHRAGILPALHRFLLQHDRRPTLPTANAGNSPNTGSCANLDTCIGTDDPQKVKDNFSAYPVAHHAHRHRAVLKIQDGCDAHCTYCLVPTLRPRVQSAPPHAVLDQARRFIAAGHREIVLSGVFLGAYGRETARRSRLNSSSEPLADLIEQLLALSGLGRLRLSSLEPSDLTTPLVRTLAASDKFCSHLHLPLQSGSDTLLKRMGRQYSTRQYLAAVELAQRTLGDLAFTTDIIVGSPGETDDDFASTLRLAQTVGFAKIHSFPFSARPDTAAWRWRDQVPPQPVVKARLKKLNRLEETLAGSFRRRFLGREVRVLVEKIQHDGDNATCLGRADQYFPVRFAGAGDLDNRLVRLRVDEVGGVKEPLKGALVRVLDTPYQERGIPDGTICGSKTS